MQDLISRDAAVEFVLDMLDGFRSAGQMEYNAYSELHDAISGLDSTAWVSVDDRLPENGTICLVCGPKGGMRIARVYRLGRTPEWTVVGTGKFFNATHWMELPAPPVD